jgi:Domain of unknown function (DUF1996)
MSRFRLGIITALATLAALSAALAYQGGGALAAATGGDFIIRCFYNGNTAAMDPILAPGSTTTDHLHVFFGNLIQGTSSFPTVTSGDAGAKNTMENNGAGDAQATNCQDEYDTAGYWQPAPYVKGAPWTNNDPGGCQANCDPASIMHLRVYYLPDSSPNTANGGGTTIQEIPDGTIMVAGFPNGCSGGVPAGDCASTSSGHLYPDDLSIVKYTCGADTRTGVFTPASAWPYNCSNYRDKDDGFNDGIVAFTSFPDCWNGKSDWAPPNNPNGKKVPGYVAPWIADPNAPTSGGQRLNDFTYAGGQCPAAFPIAVVQLEERFHLLTSGSGFGEPSTCSENGRDWNNPADNAEWNDGDGSTPHTCNAATAPSANINLSFACSPPPNGDSNCTTDTGVLGCGSGTGHCFIGASPYGWETFHADYWQTWQEGGGTDVNPEPDQGAFTDLVEDCSNEVPAGDPVGCSFINTTTQIPRGRVFGTETP